MLVLVAIIDGRDYRGTNKGPCELVGGSMDGFETLKNSRGQCGRGTTPRRSRSRSVRASLPLSRDRFSPCRILRHCCCIVRDSAGVVATPSRHGGDRRPSLTPC